MASPPEPVKGEILAEARHARTLSVHDRRVVVTHLFERCVDAKLQATEEIFELAYDDRKGRAYWSGWLTNDFSDLYQFIRFLEIHSGKARDLLYISRSSILEAFSIASRARPGWLRHVSGERHELGRSNHPAHLAGWEICRGPAVDWLLHHPEFKEELPAKLLRYLVDDTISSGVQGRPSSVHLIVEEVRRRGVNGAEPMKRSAWNRDLARWLAEQHPEMPPATAKTIGNSQQVGIALNELGLLKPVT